MPNITITVSTGALMRIQNAGVASGFSDGPSYVKECVRREVLIYERAQATIAPTQASAVAYQNLQNATAAADAAVATDFAST